MTVTTAPARPAILQKPVSFAPWISTAILLALWELAGRQLSGTFW